MTALYQFKDQNMSITLTEKAARRVRTFLENRGKGIGLRLGVKTSGCSGFRLCVLNSLMCSMMTILFLSSMA